MVQPPRADDASASPIPAAVRSFLAHLPIVAEGWRRLETLAELYADLLIVNQRHNLTRIVSADEFWSKHVADSLAVGFACPELVCGCQQVADVGCGAGFPAIPLLAANPNLHLTAIETNQKKAAFVADELAKLQFANGKALNRQAREAGRLPEYAATFQTVLARAVQNPPGLVRECRQLLMVHPAAVLVVYTTPAGVAEHLPLATREAAKYGLVVHSSRPVALPLNAGARQFLLFRRPPANRPEDQPVRD